MKPKHIEKLFLSEIETVANTSDKYCSNPGRDFSRIRKLSFKKVVESIIGMGSKGITNELIDIINNDPDMPSASAFVQQRSKIKPEAFRDILAGFTKKNALVIADRGYESYNNIAHIQEKGWFFLIRIKDGKPT